jgi:hypothetical protein
MKALQRGICVVLMWAALGCGSEPNQLFPHGVSGHRRLGQLSEAEAVAVCQRNNGPENYGQQLFSLQREACVDAAVQFTQSREDCAEFALVCMDGEADIELRSQLSGGMSQRQNPRGECNLSAVDKYAGCDATVDQLEQCMWSLWTVDAAMRRRPAFSCTTAAGGVVIMRPLLMHASFPARQPGHRRVLHIEFGPPALPGGLTWAKAWMLHMFANCRNRGTSV